MDYFLEITNSKSRRIKTSNASYFYSEFDVETVFGANFQSLVGVYNAESEFASEDSLSCGPTMATNSSHSKNVLFHLLLLFEKVKTNSAPNLKF